MAMSSLIGWDSGGRPVLYCHRTKKLFNMKNAEIPFVICALGTVIKGLFQVLEELEIRGRVETIKTSALLR